MPTVGFAGIGRMGLAMARNLLGAGFPLVVWNRTAERCAPLVDEGAALATGPEALAVADVVVTMLSDGQAARAVLVESGLLEHPSPRLRRAGDEHHRPYRRRRARSAEAERHRVRLLDAPVSGSVSVAEAAQLFAMVGGEREAYTLATPVLDAMTKGHMLLGPSGAGAAMKLAVNAMIAVTNESVAETLALAERFGIERERAYDVLAGGALASPFVLYKRGAFLQPETEPVAFTTALMRKDTALAHDLAARLGVRMPAAAGGCERARRSIRRGLAEADMASVISLLVPTTGSAPRAHHTTTATEER